MTDVFDYVSPYGILGKLADWLFLKRYMTDLLVQRNNGIKEYAENQSERQEDSLYNPMRIVRPEGVSQTVPIV